MATLTANTFGLPNKAQQETPTHSEYQAAGQTWENSSVGTGLDKNFRLSKAELFGRIFRLAKSCRIFRLKTCLIFQLTKSYRIFRLKTCLIFRLTKSYRIFRLKKLQNFSAHKKLQKNKQL
jgi:hypothetical protein